MEKNLQNAPAATERLPPHFLCGHLSDSPPSYRHKGRTLGPPMDGWLPNLSSRTGISRVLLRSRVPHARSPDCKRPRT